MNAPLKGLTELINGLSRQDTRLEQFELLASHIELFHPDAEELCDLLPSLFTVDQINDEEVAHYLKYLKAAVMRHEQKRLAGWPGDEDEIDAYKLKEARNAD